MTRTAARFRPSDAQVNALAILHGMYVAVGMHSFAGISGTTIASLEKRGLVTLKGVRKPQWTLTADGEHCVTELVEKGRVVNA